MHHYLVEITIRIWFRISQHHRFGFCFCFCCCYCSTRSTTSCSSFFSFLVWNVSLKRRWSQNTMFYETSYCSIDFFYRRLTCYMLPVVSFSKINYVIIKDTNIILCEEKWYAILQYPLLMQSSLPRLSDWSRMMS